MSGVKSEIKTEIKTEVMGVAVQSKQVIYRFVQELQDGQTKRGKVPMPLSAAKTQTRIEATENYYKACLKL